MTNNKFNVVSQRMEETETGEKIIYVVYNHLKKGVKLSEMKTSLKDTLESIPKDKNNKPLEYKITTLTSVGWRSGKDGWATYDKNKPNHINVYDAKEIYDVDDLEEIKHYSAVLVFRRQKEKAGGFSVNDKNDCLFYALKQSDNVLPWRTPITFKRFLQVGREDKINIDLIPKIEEKLRLSVRVSGDVNFCSGSEYPKTVHLKLIDGHYTLHKSKAKAFQLLKKSLFKSKKPLELMIFKKVKDSYEIMTENKEIQIIAKESFYNMTNEIKTKSKKYCSYGVNSVNVETYEKLHKEIKDLEEFGVYVLHYTNIKNAVLAKLYYESLKRFEVEDLDPLESQFLDKALSGGIIHRKPGTYENVKYYDINSQYPHILANTGLLFPTGKPEFKKLIEFYGDFIPFGVYRAVINKGQETNPFLFRLKTTHYYTHYEIIRARELNYTIELIQDGQANAMLYNGQSRAPAKAIFKNYVQKFYNIKKESKNSIAKTFLNLIWGALTQRHKTYKTLQKSGDTNLHITHSINKEKMLMVEQYKNDKLFKYPYARLGIFLTAYGRCMISRTVEPIIEDVLRVHTDGFLIRGGVELPTGDKMGQLKLEYQKQTITI